MFQAGKYILLAALFLVLSGVHSQSFAREKLLSGFLADSPKNSTCTLLQAKFVTLSTTCELKKLPQSDLAQIAEEKSESETSNAFSYETEPTYYIPAVETPTPTVTPVENVMPLAPITSQQPLDLFPAEGPNLDSNLILSMINTHRTAIGKPAFQQEGALCSLAQTRSIELQGELFEGIGYLHSGLYNRNLPYWITENAKYGSNEAGTVQWWLNSPIHRRAIEGDYTYSCGACSGTKCAQLFTSYSPKASPINYTQTSTATPSH